VRENPPDPSIRLEEFNALESISSHLHAVGRPLDAQDLDLKAAEVGVIVFADSVGNVD
jgi:hypothetical protein